MHLDDLSTEMVVLELLIDLTSTSGRTVLEHYGPLIYENLFSWANRIPESDLSHVELIDGAIGWGCELNSLLQWGVNTPYHISNFMMSCISY